MPPGSASTPSELTRKYAQRRAWEPQDPRRHTALIPGLVVELLVGPGERVQPGQSLLVIEAMKMQNHVTAREEAVVGALHVAKGETVAKGQLLVELR